MAIKIEMLRCFAAVAHSGNLADAAETLGRTPSAVSMMLKQFEEHLGKPLFEAGRKSRLTALGDFTLGIALREIGSFERSVRAIESYARAEAGLLRVAAVTSVAVAILPEAISQFIARHRDVEVELHDTDSPGVLNALQNEKVDLGLATLIENRPGLEAEALFSDRFGAICTQEHPLARHTGGLNWSEIAPYRLIANSICAGVTASEYRQIRGAATLTVHNTSSAMAMVRAGMGITVLPQLVMRGHGKDGLCFLPVADSSAIRRIDILRRAHTSPSPAQSAFEAIVATASAKLVAEML